MMAKIVIANGDTAVPEEAENQVPIDRSQISRAKSLMDSCATKAGAIAFNVNNPVSTRSIRKSKSKIATPKKLIDRLTSRVSSKNLGDGVIAAHKEYIKESPTFFAFFKEENISKNAKPNEQYILAQVPFNGVTQTDFYRMLNQISPDSIVIMDSQDSQDMKFVLPDKYENQAITVTVGEGQKCEGYTVRHFTVNKNKMKLYFIDGWKEDKDPPRNLVKVHEKIRKAIGPDNKSVIILVCKDGCTRCGLFCLVDIEAERFRLKGRMKFGETVKHIRNQRSHCFDTLDLFETAITLTEHTAKKFCDKNELSKVIG